MSVRQLVKSSFFMGRANIIKIALRLVQMKLLAIMLQPSGLGVLGIFNNLLEMGEKAAGLGMRMSSVRSLAAVRTQEAELTRMAKVLAISSLLQGAVAILVLTLFRQPISEWLFDSAEYASAIPLVGAAVLVALMAGYQQVLLQSTRNISALANLLLYASLLGTVCGVATIWFLGMEGIIWFVLLQPAAILVLGFYVTRTLSQKIHRAEIGWEEGFSYWKQMASLGVMLMITGVITSFTVLSVREYIIDQSGLEAAGFFAAAWSISITYTGLLLNSINTDYYPHISEIIEEKPAAVRAMNDQAQIALAFGGPILVFFIGTAPWLITVLYTAAFVPAAAIMKWQMSGNILKFCTNQLGTAFMAAGMSRSFFAVNTLWNLLFFGFFWWGYRHIGLEAAGVAFLLASAIQLLSATWIMRHYFQFRWQLASLSLLLFYAALAVALIILQLYSEELAALAALVLTPVCGVVGARLMLQKIGTEGKLPAMAARLFARIGWPVRETGGSK